MMNSSFTILFWAIVMLLGVVVFWLSRTRLARLKHIDRAVTPPSPEESDAIRMLRQSEEKYRILVTHQNDLIVKVDLEGCFQYVSPSYCDLFGKTEEELLGKKFIPLVHEEDRQITEMEMKKIFDPPHKVYIEQRAMTRKGWRWIAWADTAVKDESGQITSIIGNGRDITENKQLQQALQESKLLFETLANNSPVGIFRTRPDGYTTYVNPRWCEISGIPAHLAMGDDWLQGVHPMDREELFREWAQASSETRLSIAEYRFLHPNGKVVWVMGQAAPETKSEGTITGYVGTITDITQRKIMEQELEKRVQERTAELQAANKELEAFAYSVSHDLRSPLRAIDGFTRILLIEHWNSINEEGRRVGNIIRDNAQYMGRLIDDLLAFSRISRFEVNQMQVDMREIVTSAFENMTSRAQRENIQFIVHDLPLTYGDPAMMRHVWINLLSNAIKFSAGKEQSRIEISYEKKNGTTIFCVKDNGIGFNMKFSGKLFGVFQRLQGALDYEGTGVGLAIAHRLINKQNGCIWAEGEEGKGAAFYFSLPDKQK